MFISEPLQRQYGRRQLTGHMTEPTYRRIDAEVAQKGTQSLPEDGIVLPEHVGAIVKEK
jgi:hypothetical protein